MDENQNNDKAEREDCNRPEEQQDRNQWSNIGPESGDYIKNVIKEINALTTIIQHEFTAIALEDENFQKALKEFKDLPDNKATETVGNIIQSFLKAIPFANSMDVNLFITVIATISEICKLDPLVNAINEMNEEILKR